MPPVVPPMVDKSEMLTSPPSDNAPPAFVDEHDTVLLAEAVPYPKASQPAVIQPTVPLPAGSKKAQRAIKAAAPKPRDPPEKKGTRKKNYSLVLVFSSLRSLVLVFAVSVIVATIFTSFTANASLSAQALNGLAIAQITEAHIAVVPTGLPTPVWLKRIGIIPGHSGIAKRGPTAGNVDPGAPCPDGFTEASVTLKVGLQVIANLRGRGYTVDQLDEYDMRLDKTNPYEAAMLLSIHADSCTNFNDGYPHSGFKAVNPIERSTVRDQDLRLVDCLRNYYGQATGLSFSDWSITPNMTDYHAFHEITQRTPAAIIELGFLYYDRDLLEHHWDKAAEGVTNGLLCFLDPKALATDVPTVIPTLPPTKVSAPTVSNNAVKPTTAPTKKAAR